MHKRISNVIATGIVLVSIIVLAGLFIVACIPQPSYLRMPSSLSAYSFTGFRPPSSMSPASVRFTVAVVEPFYKERVHHDYSKVIRSFSNSVGVGLDQILISKGMTTKGPYGSLDEIPYPDKQNSNLTLTETVFIVPVEKEQRNTEDINYYDSNGNTLLCEVKSGKLAVEIWLAFEMREPLSAEKMWIKRLDLGVFERDYQIGTKKYWHSNPQTDPWAPPTGAWKYGEMMFNTKPDMLADILNEVYPKLMNSAWVYLDADEMKRLEIKVKEIRELKRY